MFTMMKRTSVVVAPARGRRPDPKTSVAAVLALLLLVGVGVAMVQGPPPPPQAQKRLTALLVGASDPASVVSRAVFDQALHAGIDAGSRLMVGPLTTGAPASDDVLVGVGGNDLEREHDLDAKRTQALDRFEGLAGDRDPAGFAMTGIHAFAQHIAAVRPDVVDVVIVGDMSRLSPEVDLNDPIVRGDPDAAVAVVGGMSGTTCAGWRVHVVGGAGPAALLDRRRDLQVREVVRRLFAACGGALTVWDPGQLPAFPVTTAVEQTVVDGDPCAARFVLSSDVLFGDGSAELQPAALLELDRLATLLTGDRSDATATIKGYTALPGTVDLWELSRSRAAGVAAYLGRRIEASRLTVEGHGPKDPVADNATEAGQKLNRRVEIVVHRPAADCPTGSGG